MPAGHIPGLNLSDYGFIVCAVGRTETVYYVMAHRLDERLF